jgi:catechol 2,3-dioxygenase-like lactoylglutathione lyase family enzyme
MTAQAKSRVATAPLHGVLPASDLARAERFYSETLGLELEKMPEAAGFMVRAGGDSSVFVYETGATAGTATHALFQVD